MRKLWRRFVAFWLPVQTGAFALEQIAQELRILRELYELELGARREDPMHTIPAPIFRITEEPGRSDTEVSYADDEPKVPNAYEKLFGVEEED